MRASAPPAAIRAAPTTNTVHPRKRRSVEMLETGLRALFLSARDRSRFVSCTMENLSLNYVDHKVRYALSLRVETCDAVPRLRVERLAQSHFVRCGAGDIRRSSAATCAIGRSFRLQNSNLDLIRTQARFQPELLSADRGGQTPHRKADIANNPHTSFFKL
jgi:hypothetical protein